MSETQRVEDMILDLAAQDKRIAELEVALLQTRAEQAERKCAELAAALNAIGAVLDDESDIEDCTDGVRPNPAMRYAGELDRIVGNLSTILRHHDAQVEREFRKTLWLNHGCDALYGDDGEMQCGKCVVDFRRQPLGEIMAMVLQRKERETLERIRAVLSINTCSFMTGSCWRTIEREFAPKDLLPAMDAEQLAGAFDAMFRPPTAEEEAPEGDSKP
jgi:hypothetical protein